MIRGEFDHAEPETVRLPSQEEIEAARAPRISDRAARMLATRRDAIKINVRRFGYSDDAQDLEDLDEVIRACGRDPETIGRLL